MDIFKSKKFWVLVTGLAALLLNHYADVAPELTEEMAAMVIAYVLGQGIADHGKEKEKVRVTAEIFNKVK